MTFEIVEKILHKEGLIRGGGGLKQIKVPPGTKIFCIAYHPPRPIDRGVQPRYFWSAYLNARQASVCMDGLEASIDGRAKRQMSLESMLAWNFKAQVPTRIAREKP